MELIAQGGLVMWPLLAISVTALALIAERFLLLLSCPFPGRAFEGLLRDAVRQGNLRSLAAYMSGVPLLKDFSAVLADEAYPHRESALRMEGEQVLRRLEARLPFLGLLARLAPLLGLLGTVVGMILTFSRIASAKSGVDMAMLADGIWQALLTTAAGLVIAIPILLCLGLIRGRVRRIGEALADAGNAALMLAEKESSRGEDAHA